MKTFPYFKGIDPSGDLFSISVVIDSRETEYVESGIDPAAIRLFTILLLL